MGDRKSDHSPVHLEFFARPEHLSEVRRLVEQLGRKSTLTPVQLDEFLTAVDEAVANAVRHGSPRGERSIVKVTCRPLPGGLLVEVRDQGKGFAVPMSPKMPDPEAAGGRGLPLMCALADAVEIASGKRGTTVTLHKAVSR